MLEPADEEGRESISSPSPVLDAVISAKEEEGSDIMRTGTTRRTTD